MKKILTILFISLALYSCEDAYNVEPDDDLLEENVLETIGDLERGIIGVYAGLSGANVIEWSSRFTDDLRLSPENRGQGVQVNNWSIVPGTGEAAGLWGNAYVVINRCNRLLAVIDNIPAATEEAEETKKRIKAECLAIRAYCHFDLFRLFSQDYDANSLSVPYINTVVVYEQPARNTVGEVITNIKADLLEAYNNLDASYTDNTRFTSIAITALRARVALYEGNLPDAISFSSEVIASQQLATTQEFGDIWLDVTEQEVMFKLARTSGDGTVGTIFRDTNGDAFFNMSIDMVNHINDYGWTGDIRTFSLIDVDNYSGPETALVGKYLGTAVNYGLNDIKILRVGEQYLIRAEAYARNNQLDLASQDIQNLRNARKFAPVTVSYSNQDVALDDILGERRMELGYEGHRFFDLKRFNKGISRLADDCALAAGACELDASDYRFSLPIPQSELFANDNMTQNNGY